MIAARLTEDGFVRFDGIRTRTQLVTLSASLGAIIAHRDSDSDGITTLENRAELGRRLGFAGFGTLPPHTDGSGEINPPALLLLVCTKAHRVGIASRSTGAVSTPI